MPKKEYKRVSADPQRNAYQLTINNPIEKGYTHIVIKEKLITYFNTLTYFCIGDEIGEKGTPHTHMYCHFRSRVRFSKVKKHFPEAHIEIAQGSVQSNIDYIKKTGKWENSEKSETRVEGTFEEYGEQPKSQKGVRVDMAELFDMINNGFSNAEILAMNNDYILNIDKLDKVRTTLLMEKYKGTRRLDLKVTYVSGATGTGKTRDILDRHGDEKVYRVNEYKNPFDGYESQPVMVLDEFRSQLSIADMLNYADIYPIQLRARYSNKYACYEHLYIVSNWKLEEQYADLQTHDPESWNAFLRRIHEVQIYEQDGTIKVYDSVDDYLHRKEKFHAPEEEEEIPFTEE